MKDNEIYLKDFDAKLYNSALDFTSDPAQSGLYHKFNDILFKMHHRNCPYYAFDIMELEHFYPTIDFTSKYFDKVSKSLCIYDKETTAQMVFDFSLSTSAYRALLEKEGIAIGDEEKDPLMIFKKEIIEEYKNSK